MPKFNMNWVYLIILIVLGILFFTNNSTDNSASAEGVLTRNFKSYVMNGWAEKVVANKDESKLRMYVKRQNI